MGIADLFKATENEKLRNENHELFKKVRELEKEIDNLNQMKNDTIFKNNRLENENKALQSIVDDLSTKEFKRSFYDKKYVDIDDLIDDISRFYSLLLLENINDYFNINQNQITIDYIYNTQSKKYKDFKYRDEIKDMCKKSKSFDYLLEKYPYLYNIFKNSNKSNPSLKGLDEAIRVISQYGEEIINDFCRDKKMYEREIYRIEEEYNYKVLEMQNEYTSKSNLLKQQEEERTRYWNGKIKEQIDNLSLIFESNKLALPYLSSISADYILCELSEMENNLKLRETKVANEKEIKIREIKKATKEIIEQGKEAIYQLDYICTLYPNLVDIIGTDYRELDFALKIEEGVDPVSLWITKSEYNRLSESDRNQLALNKYIESRSKSNWQIGRDYELSIGYLLEKEDYKVEYTGTIEKLEDMGRDLIAEKNGDKLIIQCKYWSKDKVIHEKHIFQLYGSLLSYSLENNCDIKKIKGVFVTNIDYSDTAIKMAELLGIKLVRKQKFVDFPRIKCNIASDGEKIYHLPIDQQYDTTVLDKVGEVKVFTVKEAEELGFRRAFRWYGN